MWGLNTSSVDRNLRDNASRKLGLVNGYDYGMVKHIDIPALAFSDNTSGTAEPIERNVRFYGHSGILRLNAFSAVARTWSNSGG